jgi:hypothetical protein
VSADGLPKSYPGHLPIETLNFMIRVTGTAMMPAD